MKKLIIGILSLACVTAVAQDMTEYLNPGQSVISIESGTGLEKKYICKNNNQKPDINYYLSLSKAKLFEHSTSGIGLCKVSLGGSNTSCDYYIRHANLGYPHGSGCSHDFNEVVSTIKQMLKDGMCI